MREAEATVGGNEDALLYNITASLSCLCAILCVISAAGMAAHNIFILTQASTSPTCGLVVVVVVGGGGGGDMGREESYLGKFGYDRPAGKGLRERNLAPCERNIVIVETLNKVANTADVSTRYGRTVLHCSMSLRRSSTLAMCSGSRGDFGHFFYRAKRAGKESKLSNVTLVVHYYLNTNTLHIPGSIHTYMHTGIHYIHVKMACTQKQCQWWNRFG